MNKLEKLLAELRLMLDLFKELRSKDKLTDDEITQKRETMKKIESLEGDIKEEEKAVELEKRALEAEERFEARLNASTNGGHPAAPATTIIVEDAPIYRTFSEQIADVITIGTAKENPGVDKRDAVKRVLAHEKRAAGTGMIVGSGIDGGLAVQSDFATDIIDKGFNNGVMLSKTAQREVSPNSNSITFLGIQEDSRVDGSRGGGVVVYTKAELQQYTASKSKLAEIGLKLNKLTGLLFLSDEMVEDALATAGEIADLFPKEFQFKLQDLIFRGSGSGEPHGLMTAPSRVSVAKTGSQVAKTITRANLSNMKARVWGDDAQWYGNKDIIPQLDTIVDATGNNKLFTQIGINKGMLDGIPIDFIEQCETLGTEGDLVLTNLSEYITLKKGGLKQEDSMHFKFDYGQKTIKWTYRFDGQSRWKSALTPYKGSNTISPIVTLAVRS